MNPLELLYYIGYSFFKRRGLSRRKKLPHPVISVGNITVGGTGKTPAVIAIAEEAMRRGFSPVVLTRGYGGRVKGPCLVSASKNPPGFFRGDPQDVIFTSADSGDEPVLMAGRLPAAAVIKSAKRYEGGMFAIQFVTPLNGAPLLFILDDGFQHWGLHRDVDVVLVNGLDPFGNRKLLPVGPLREPLGELRRADIFVITKCGKCVGKEDTGLAGELAGNWPLKPVYFSDYKAVRVMNNAAAEHSPGALRDKRVFAFCGIGHPESFRQSLLALRIRLEGFQAYRDHYRYAQTDMDYLVRRSRELRCEIMLTTEKDMIKLRELEMPDNVFGLEIIWRTETAFYDGLFKKIVD